MLRITKLDDNATYTLTERLDAARSHRHGMCRLYDIRARAAARHFRHLRRARVRRPAPHVHVPRAIRHVLQGRLPPLAPSGVALVAWRLPGVRRGRGDGSRHSLLSEGQPAHPRRSPPHVHHQSVRLSRARRHAEAGRQPRGDDHLHLPLQLHHGAHDTRLLPAPRWRTRDALPCRLRAYII